MAAAKRTAAKATEQPDEMTPKADEPEAGGSAGDSGEHVDADESTDGSTDEQVECVGAADGKCVGGPTHGGRVCSYHAVWYYADGTPRGEAR